MNIKSLLLGSAAAMIAVSGARAADAVVIAEPEPVEYVRVCDVYGTGYFYIPGTETCLKIGGYFRYEIRNINVDFDDTVFGDDDFGYSKRARFAPTFTAKSETELGTLTGYARLFAQWDTGFGGGAVTNSTTVDHMQISLATATGTVLIGKGDSPYARFLGYGGPTIFDGDYGFNNTGELSYTYTGANGFSAIIAAVEDPEDDDWEPNGEAGINFAPGWGSIGAMVGYDENADNWGAKAAVRLKIPNTAIDFVLMGFYSEDNGVIGDYTITDGADAYVTGDIAEFSVLAGASVALTEKIGVAGTFQWFDTDEYFAAVAMPITPVAGLAITPEVQYSSRVDDITGIVRFQRNF